MKKLALLAAFAALCSVSYAQKATVDLNNYDNGTTPSNPVFYLTSGTFVDPSAGISFAVFGPNNTALQMPDGSAISYTWAEPGLFYIGPVVVPGATAGGTTTLTFEAWKGASFETATEKVSASWTQTLGSYDPTAVPAQTPAGPLLSLPTGLTVTGVVPEPTTLALGLIGAAALMLRRRK